MPHNFKSSPIVFLNLNITSKETQLNVIELFAISQPAIFAAVKNNFYSDRLKQFILKPCKYPNYFSL